MLEPRKISQLLGLFSMVRHLSKRSGDVYHLQYSGYCGREQKQFVALLESSDIAFSLVYDESSFSAVGTTPSYICAHCSLTGRSFTTITFHEASVLCFLERTLS
ncbi:hypothetical protein FRX31_011312 [Thalictrum thalictroides]|uniref:Uncharacterized protein n=1 Tax=Thalictrum thalictroides TaxID=46969 RepID=A0A7J6WR64_THATH|nr:hypothetical protein FRX31_011312 [Thalictrum thalictroides]